MNTMMQHKEFLLYYTQDRGYRTDFFSSIHENDEMYYKAILPGYKSADLAARAYIQSGGRMLDVVSQLLELTFGENRNIDFLEFASGYGRFTRHLVQILASNHIWVSDIYKPAVDWLSQELHVNGFYSAPDPNNIDVNKQFDFIFVGSLFSHLPESLFVHWLSTLFNLLKEGGILAFSVHDTAISKSPGEEYVYERWSESDTLSTDIYGMTYVSHDFVQKSVANNINYHTDLRHIICGLYEAQDLYVLSKNKNINWKTEDLHISPSGGWESIQLSANFYIINGWGVSLDYFDDIVEARVISEKTENNLATNVTITKDISGRIKKYFPRSPNIPLLWCCIVDSETLEASKMIKCRLSTKSRMFFDVYIDKLV